LFLNSENSVSATRFHDKDPDIRAEADDFGEPVYLQQYYAMGIDPTKSTTAKPGTDEKVLMLSARYAAGISLWDARDCDDHGPTERDLIGMLDESRPSLLPAPVRLA
jgi:hypothetical protein